MTCPRPHSWEGAERIQLSSATFKHKIFSQCSSPVRGSGQQSVMTSCHHSVEGKEEAHSLGWSLQNVWATCGFQTWYLPLCLSAFPLTPSYHLVPTYLHLRTYWSFFLLLKTTSFSCSFSPISFSLLLQNTKAEMNWAQKSVNTLAWLLLRLWVPGHNLES